MLACTKFSKYAIVAHINLNLELFCLLKCYSSSKTSAQQNREVLLGLWYYTLLEVAWRFFKLK